jgi:hypothetical protein
VLYMGQVVGGCVLQATPALDSQINFYFHTVRGGWAQRIELWEGY